jgi:hypothetical protein
MAWWGSYICTLIRLFPNSNNFWTNSHLIVERGVEILTVKAFTCLYFAIAYRQ